MCSMPITRWRQQGGTKKKMRTSTRDSSWTRRRDFWNGQVMTSTTAESTRKIVHSAIRKT